MKAKLVFYISMYIYFFALEVESRFDPNLLCKYSEVKTALCGYERIGGKSLHSNIVNTNSCDLD